MATHPGGYRIASNLRLYYKRVLLLLLLLLRIIFFNLRLHGLGLRHLIISSVRSRPTIEIVLILRDTLGDVESILRAHLQSPECCSAVRHHGIFSLVKSGASIHRKISGAKRTHQRSSHGTTYST